MSSEFDELETPPTSEGSFGIDIGILLVSLKRSIIWIFIATFIITAAAYFFAKSIKPNYQARAILLKHNKNNSVNPDIYYEPNLRTILETVKLRENLERLKIELALEDELDDLFKKIDVKQGHRNDMIQILATDDKSDRAAQMANSISEIFQASSAGISRSVARRVYNFRLSQKRSLNKALIEAQGKMQAFLLKHKISFYEASTNMLMEQLKQLELDLGNAKIQKEKDRLRIREISQALSNRPEDIRVTSTIRYRNRVKQEELQTELSRLLERYTEDNPKVISVQRQLDALGRELETPQKRKPEEESYGMDPVVRSLKIERSQLKSGLQGGEKQVETLNQTILGHRKKLARLATVEKEYDNLKREIDVITENLRDNEFKMAEAENAMKSNISNFDLVEQAKPPLNPLPTRKKLVVIAGFLLGLIGSILLAALKELLDFRMKSIKDLEYLKIDSLGMVPRRDQVNDRKYYHHWLLAFHQLNLRLKELDKPALILVCSENSDEGKSFLLEQIINTLNHQGDKTVYINSVTELVPERQAHILNDFLQQPQGLMPVLQTLDKKRQQLYFHLSEDAMKFPLIPEKIKKMLELLHEADYIFWELPALKQQLHTASMLSGFADATILVSGFRHSQRSNLKRSLQTLQESQMINVWGVLNNVDRPYHNA